MSVIAAISLAAGAAALPATGASTRTVKVKDDVFGPKKMTISKGAKVVWVWRGQEKHNVSVVSGPAKFRFGTRRKGKRSHTFKKRGTYRLVCTIHAPDMNMKIVVK